MEAWRSNCPRHSVWEDAILEGLIEVIENAERIEKMLPELDQMIGGGLVTLEKVRVILYRSNK